jgi:hypothetical protein
MAWFGTARLGTARPGEDSSEYLWLILNVVNRGLSVKTDCRRWFGLALHGPARRGLARATHGQPHDRALQISLPDAIIFRKEARRHPNP